MGKHPKSSPCPHTPPEHTPLVCLGSSHVQEVAHAVPSWSEPEGTLVGSPSAEGSQYEAVSEASEQLTGRFITHIWPPTTPQRDAALGTREGTPPPLTRLPSPWTTIRSDIGQPGLCSRNPHDAGCKHQKDRVLEAPGGPLARPGRRGPGCRHALLCQGHLVPVSPLSVITLLN